jgi:hypothetical protein
MIPSIGRIVHYTLDEADASQINRRRADALATDHKAIRSGAQVHAGNGVSAGDVFPLVITKLWTNNPDHHSVINGQVLLDGNDTLWVASVKQGDGEREWRQPVHV